METQAERRVLAIIHEDGHVAGFTSDRQLRERLMFELRVMQAVGIKGWHAEALSETEAAERHVAGLECPDCVMRLQCGCRTDHVAAGGCPHGGAYLIATAAQAVAP